MKYALLVIAVMLVNVTFGQGGYQPGFLLTSSLDTVPGLIRFSSKASVPTPCLYRVDKKSQAKEVFPGTVHGFCTNNGAYYFTRSIGRSDDVFLEVLVKGYLNLFKFGDMFFIEKADSAFFELSDELEILFVEGQHREQKSHNYSRMLSLVTADCPEVSKQANTVPLKEKQLVRLVASYNACKGSVSNFYRVKNKR